MDGCFGGLYYSKDIKLKKRDVLLIKKTTLLENATVGPYYFQMCGENKVNNK